MKNNLNQLVKDYKETAKKETLNEIYKIINPILEEKAAYVYYKKIYNKGGKSVSLKETNIIAEEDVLNELWVTTMEIIKNCKPDKPFINYFYATLWRWKPNFVDQNFLFQKNFVLASSLITDDNLNLLENLEIAESNIESEFEELNDKENEIVKLIFCDPKINQEDLAKKLNISQSSVSNILNEIRKKIKIYNKLVIK